MLQGHPLAMPALLKAKYEAVAQALAAGKSIKDCYIAGGFKYVGSSATTFCQRPDIRARASEIVAQRSREEGQTREIAVREAGLTESWIVERLKYLTERSLRGQPVFDKDGVQIPGRFTGKPDGATAIRCLTLAAQMKGLLINRHELGLPGDFARLSDQELAAKITEDAHAVGMPADVIQAMLEKQGLSGAEQ